MIKVLIVEDDPMVIDINSRFLEKVDGFSLVASALSIEKAKEIIEKDKPDLIILDMFFPKDKGMNLIKWIRSNEHLCDVIFITAESSNEVVEEAFRFGAVDYLIKPFIFDRFKMALNTYKNRKDILLKDVNIGQADIDKLTISNETTHSDSLELGDFESMKGFSHHTYGLVMAVIKDLGEESFTSNKIAELIGVSRITARRYLDYLECNSVLEIEHQYGKIGRPQNKYRLKK
ncbi:MAG: response regulator [Acidaminobacteraceae bacterium]